MLQDFNKSSYVCISTVALSVGDGLARLSGDRVTLLLGHGPALLPGHVVTHLLGHRGALLPRHLPRNLLAVLLRHVVALLLCAGNTLLGCQGL